VFIVNRSLAAATATSKFDAIAANTEYRPEVVTKSFPRPGDRGNIRAVAAA
jgi:hypothetical protein